MAHQQKLGGYAKSFVNLFLNIYPPSSKRDILFT